MKKKQKELWAALHWLGRIAHVGDEKTILKFCKSNSPNPKHPIFHAVPLSGVKHIICDKCSGSGSLVVPNEFEKILHKRYLP